MKLSMRAYRNEDDYWAIRQFLRDVYLQNGRRQHSWHVARLDWWRWHGIMNLGDGDLETGVVLWETSSGELAAVLNREGAGQAFLQVDPRYRTGELEDEMLSVAEEQLSTIGLRSGRPVLEVYAHDGDGLRTGMLARHGYARRAICQEMLRTRDLGLPIPEPTIPQGYTIRAMGADDADLARRSWASWRAFHADEPDEKYDGDTSWLRNPMRAPLYRRDLDLVVEAPSGEIAAFATVWYDDVTRSGYFEPVGCVPEHQRRGLAKVLLLEGMRRMRDLGAVVAATGGGGESNPPAEALYLSAFGTTGESYTAWEKYLDRRD